jgi:1,4-alpha-glucan branching enzyme
MASGNCSSPESLSVGYYKYEILAQDGELLALKADPYAFAFEPETPRTANTSTKSCTSTPPM